jgi:hypothetical protein
MPACVVSGFNRFMTCADGNGQFDKLAWTSWTPRLASAAGTLEENDCIPYGRLQQR